MAKFWIDFSASILVEAETREEAEEKFWNCNKLDDIAIEWIEKSIRFINGY